jgi:serine-type D-Ala-D-Ala carboxypeptidase/endopeptidase (penicillin-binding protein 4)
LGRLVGALTVMVAVTVVAGVTVLVVVTSDHHHSRVGIRPSASTTSTTALLTNPGTAPATSARPTTTVPPPTAVSPAVARLATRLDGALAGTRACLLVADGNTAIYTHQPSEPLAPASTEKLLVAASALKVLGPDFRFVTQVMAPAAPVNGRVNGLWLVGSGDPLLSSPEWIAYEASRPRLAAYPWTPLGSLADMLVAAGIHQVVGGVRGDDSYLDRLRFLPVWPVSYEPAQEIAPLSALMLNEGVQQWIPAPLFTPDPPAFASSELARLLAAQHVAVGPSGTVQNTPAGSVVVAQIQSAPLSQIIQTMLTASDNLIAELLVRQIDRHNGGMGTTAGGVAAVMQQAAALGVSTAGGVMLDGSGLAPGDRATCTELLSALDVGGRTGFQPIADGLAIAGETGTLINRFVGTPLAGKLRAKTGSIANAGGIVGVLLLTRRVQFAFLINQPLTYPELLAKEDAVIAALATYPEAA